MDALLSLNNACFFGNTWMIKRIPEKNRIIELMTIGRTYFFSLYVKPGIIKQSIWYIVKGVLNKKPL